MSDDTRFTLAGFISAALVITLWIVDGNNEMVLYWGFASFLSNTFPYAHLAIACLLGGLAGAGVVGAKVLDESPDPDTGFIFDTSAIVGVLLGVLTVSGALVGTTMGQREDLGVLLLEIFHVPYFLLFYLGNVLPIGIIIYMSPYYLAGLIALGQRHPATAVVEASTMGVLPAQEAERALATVLRSQEARDQEIQGLLESLSAWKSWTWRVRYRAYAREAARLRALAEAKTAAHQEEAELVRSVHKLERRRRAVAAEKPSVFVPKRPTSARSLGQARRTVRSESPSAAGVASGRHAAPAPAGATAATSSQAGEKTFNPRRPNHPPRPPARRLWGVIPLPWSKSRADWTGRGAQPRADGRRSPPRSYDAVAEQARRDLKRLQNMW